MTSLLENEALEKEGELLDIDPIWTTSRTARQIYALGEAEKVLHTNRESRLSHHTHRISLVCSLWRPRPYHC